MNSPLISALIFFIVAVNVIISCAKENRHYDEKEDHVRHMTAKLRRRWEVSANDDRLNRNQRSRPDSDWTRIKRINKDKRRKNKRNSSPTEIRNAGVKPERWQTDERARALPDDRGVNKAHPKKPVDTPDDTKIVKPEAIPIAVRSPYGQRRVTINYWHDLE